MFRVIVASGVSSLPMMYLAMYDAAEVGSSRMISLILMDDNVT